MRAARPAASLALCASLLFACVPSEERDADTNGGEESPYVCPPCGMKMPAGTELTEIAGSRWAACNERCAQIIASEPEAFTEHAVED